MISLRRLLVSAVLVLLATACGEARSDTVYVCPPCAPHDTLTFEHDGTCPVCGMELVEKPDTSRVGPAHIHEGSGNFTMEGGAGHRDRRIFVYYHRPEGFTPESPILLVVPGAGRNAWEYRDAWLEASREHGVLVLSPRYPEETYGFARYQAGGIVKDLNVRESADFLEDSHQVRLDEGRLTFEVNDARDQWIFRDFDRIFEEVAAAVGSKRSGYDIFGHSAGGQILHRMVLFHPGSKAERIVAANAGFYTMPDPDARLPFGLEGAGVTVDGLRSSLGEPLLLLLGEEDDHPEAGGTFLRSPSADEQGSGRLQRGGHFHEAGRALAEELGVDFGWELRTVPGVGHDGGAMSRAAAELLYGEGTAD